MVLAGGEGRRLGGAKAVVELAGRPLVAWPLAALRAVVGEAVVVGKRDTPLPDGVAAWREPDEPRHPLAGIAFALRRARGHVLVCAVDLPLVGEGELRALLAAPAGAPAAVARGPDGRVQPLLGVYRPAALDALAEVRDEPAGDVVQGLGATLVDVSAEALLNVNTPDDLARAEALLASRR